MRLTIQVDNIPHTIDSTDPELLGKWVAEIFGRAVAFGINAATLITVQAYPSWVPDASSPSGGIPDWIADTRIIGRAWEIRTPRELVAALAEQLDQAEAEGLKT